MLTILFFLLQIQEDGEAKEAGLRVGDRLLCVNGRDIRGLTHDDAVKALMPNSIDEVLVVEVRRDPLPPGLRVSRNRSLEASFPTFDRPCCTDEPVNSIYC